MAGGCDPVPDQSSVCVTSSDLELLPFRLDHKRRSRSAVGLAFGGPRGAVAIGVLALDDGGPEVALAGIVGRFDLARKKREGQELIAGAAHLVLYGAGKVAGGRSRQEIVQPALQRPPLGRDGGCCERGDGPGQGEGRTKPQLEPQRDRGIVALERRRGPGAPSRSGGPRRAPAGPSSGPTAGPVSSFRR